MTDARIMGIVNVTPDSFSDGGPSWIRTGRLCMGRSSPPRAPTCSTSVGVHPPRSHGGGAEQELHRVQPVIEGLAGAGTEISIDTSKVAVAEAALDAGAAMVNDVTALRPEPELAGLCAERNCELVLMHMLGEPRTMQENRTYDDVVDDVKAFLAERIEFAISEGIGEARIWVDPHRLWQDGRAQPRAPPPARGARRPGPPDRVRSSRKSFIGKLTGAEVDQRLGGTIASNVIAYANGRGMLRVHEVAPMRQALIVAEAILDPDRGSTVIDRR